jgi:hypothetical protein
MTGPLEQRRCGSGIRRVLVAVVACGLITTSCTRDTDTTPSLATPPVPAAASPAGGAVPHGDHNPQYGGIVLMNGDLHFELVAGRNGDCRVYFSDATRTELPAATASGVTVTIVQKEKPPDVVTLRIDDNGESWVGHGRPVEDPAATIRVAYTAQGKPYFIDLPFPR